VWPFSATHSPTCHNLSTYLLSVAICVLLALIVDALIGDSMANLLLPIGDIPPKLECGA